MLARMTRVVRLDRAVYPEVESDPTATLTAAAVVVLVAVAGVVGTGLQIAVGTAPRSAHPPGAIAGSLLGPVLHWLIWSALTFAIGTTLFGGRTTYPTMLRALGYAQAPQVLAVLGFLPLVGPVCVVLGQLLSLRAGSLAAQDALGLPMRRTIAAILVSFAVAFVVRGAVTALLAHVSLLSGLVSP